MKTRIGWSWLGYFLVLSAAVQITHSTAQAQLADLSWRSVPGIVARFDFNSPDEVFDKVGGVIGSVYGTDWVKGYNGNGRDFDGVDDWVDCGNVLNLAEGDFTISVWVYPRSNNLGMLVNKGAYWHVVGSYYLFLLPEGIRFVVSDGGEPGWAGVEGNNEPLELNTWQHVAATFHRTGSGSELAVYVDGELWDKAVTPRGCQQSNENFEIGAYFHPWYGYTFCNFDGVMDELLVFNRSLSQAEIKKVAGIKK